MCYGAWPTYWLLYLCGHRRGTHAQERSCTSFDEAEPVAMRMRHSVYVSYMSHVFCVFCVFCVSHEGPCFVLSLLLGCA